MNTKIINNKFKFLPLLTVFSGVSMFFALSSVSGFVPQLMILLSGFLVLHYSYECRY